MAKKQIRKHETGYTQVTNILLNDKTISWKAKGIYAYIFSKPDAWDFSARRMALDVTDGRDGTLSGIKELEQAGYITREKLPDGRILYHVLIDPKQAKAEQGIEDPKPAKATEAKSHHGQTRSISNKEDIVIKSTSNKEILLHSFYGELGNVQLLPEEYQKLEVKLGTQTLLELIEDLSLYIPNKPGKKYTSHYAVLCQWSKRKSKEVNRNQKTFSVIT